MPTTMDWTAEVLDQIETHWQERLRPRLEGLTDEEYAHFGAGVRSLGDAGLAEPQGHRSPPAFAHAPVARVVLYMSVEAFHHGAEVCHATSTSRRLARWRNRRGPLPADEQRTRRTPSPSAPAATLAKPWQRSPIASWTWRRSC